MDISSLLALSPILVTILAGIFIIIYFYKNSAGKEDQTSVSSVAGDNAPEAISSAPGGGGEKQSKKRSEKKAPPHRDSRQKFSHAWLVSSLKGHNGDVLDMSFSPNGKYLASCAEDGAAAGLDVTCAESAAAAMAEVRPPPAAPAPAQTDSPSSGDTPDQQLSPPAARRKRKKRIRHQQQQKAAAVVAAAAERRDSGSEQREQKQQPPRASSEPAAPASGDSSGQRQEQKLDLPGEEVYHLLRRYMLPPEQLHILGFPHSSSLKRDRAYIYKGPSGAVRPGKKVKLDAGAKEFVPRALVSSDCDSGNHSSENGDDSSGSCSGEGDEAQVPDDVSEPESLHSSGSESSETPRAEPRVTLLRPHCVRCGKQFAITLDGVYRERGERCVFHWGRLQGGGGARYSCCEARPHGRGCSTAPCHVWSGLLPGLNGPLKGYVRTRRRRVPPADGNHGVYALDCEMCYTGQGLELARVSVVGVNGKRVYDALVRPERPVVDYNTRFSGITARQLEGATKTLRHVQSDLMGFISADTVLIGHGLENDLRALRLVHGVVIDTSVLFPHYLGLPYRRRLCQLTSSCLNWRIQEHGGQSHRGHDSLEDARACVQLVLWRLRKDLCLP